MKRAYGLIPSLELGLGLLFLFTARQVLGPGDLATILTWVGLAGVLGALVWRALERARAPAAAKPVEGMLLLAYGGVALAIALYGLRTEWGLSLLGAESEREGGLAGVLGVLWPAVLLVSGMALVFMEAAYIRMPIAEAVDARRVRSTAQDGLSIALALVFVVSVNYVAANRDVRKDVSYFRVTRPSEQTLRRVEALTEPIHVVLFYPAVNDVLPQLRPYFEEVAGANDDLTVEVRDHALSPALTRKHRIRDNGFVLLTKGDGEGQQGESFEVGVELEGARARLRTLDGRFQEAFMKLSTRRRDVHVTAGHDEHTKTGVEGDTPREHIGELDAAFERSNITTRPLGMAQGLAQGVPEGTPAVAVIGPRKPFLPEEARALLDYVNEGGRLLVMVDPDVDHGLDPLLLGLGLRMLPGVLTSDRQFVRRDYADSDRSIVRTSSYSSHPVVTLASRNSARIASVFIRGGAFEKHEGSEVLEGTNVVFPVRSGMFWLDQDGDYERGTEERLGMYNMIAAVTVPVAGGSEAEGRAVVIADGDFATDQVIRNPGNALVIGDAMQWLLGEEQLVTETATEEDQLIEHTTEEDKLWFWGTSFGVPLPLLFIGFFVASRTTRRRSRPEERAGRGAPKAGSSDAASGGTGSGAREAVAAGPAGRGDHDGGEDAASGEDAGSGDDARPGDDARTDDGDGSAPRGGGGDGEGDR